MVFDIQQVGLYHGQLLAVVSDMACVDMEVTVVNDLSSGNSVVFVFDIQQVSLYHEQLLAVVPDIDFDVSVVAALSSVEPAVFIEGNRALVRDSLVRVLFFEDFMTMKLAVTPLTVLFKSRFLKSVCFLGNATVWL